VIGPIGDKLAEHGTPERELYEESLEIWESVIQPACRAVGLEPLRADKIAKSGEIPEQICRHLRDDEVVVADLSRANPNVMYELGLRHTTPKITVQIGEQGRLPFDVAAIRTIKFRRSEGGLIAARKELEEALRVAFEEGQEPVTATRVWLGSEAPNPLVSTAVAQSPSETGELASDEGGFLDTLAAAEESMAGMAEVVGGLASRLQQIGEHFRESTSEAKRSDATGGGFGGRLAVANRLALKLEAEGQQMRPLVERYEGMMQRIAPGIEMLLTRIEAEPRTEELDRFLTQISQLAGSVVESIQKSSGFAHSVAGVGESSKSLRRSAAIIVDLVQRFRDASSPAVSWKAAVERLHPEDSN